MSQILDSLTSDQRRRYRKGAAELQLQPDRILPGLPDNHTLVLSSDAEDPESIMEPCFSEAPITGKRRQAQTPSQQIAVFGIEHLCIQTHKPLIIRGRHPVVIHTARVTLQAHAQIRIETPTRLSTQILESVENAPPILSIVGPDGPNGQAGSDGRSPSGAGDAGGPGSAGGAAPFFFSQDLGVVKGPVIVMNYGGAGGSGGDGGNGAAPNGSPGPGGPGGDGGSGGLVTLTYEEFKPGGYVQIWNLPGLGGSGGSGGLAGNGKTKGNPGNDGRQYPPGSVSFGKKPPDQGS
jgi:hypothetical protein